MPDEAAVDAEKARRPTRRAARRLAVGGVVVALAATVAVVRPGFSSGAGSIGAPPHFVDETNAAGVTQSYQGGFDYFVGGGVAAFDCNDDGRPDLYFAGGTAPAALYVNESPIGGALRFTRQPSPLTDLTSVTGAYPLDIDGDGHEDLVVLRNGKGNVVLRGLGGCRFEQANDRFGLDPGTDWSAAFSATWEGSNRLPTLAFGSYLQANHEDCGVSKLVRPSAAGDRYGAPIPLSPGYCALSLLFSDWNRSGERDLRVSNDRHYYIDGQEQLWRIVPGQPPRLYTQADGWRPLQIWGMGIASQDVNGDGYPDLFLTSQGDNKLQTLANGPGQPAYRDMALKDGVTATRPFVGGDVLPSTAWHAEFADVNNDGLPDLFVSKGNVEAQPGQAMRDPSNLFIGRADGTFTEGAVAAGIVDYDSARGAAVVDLNLDGLPDLVVVNRQTNVKLWRNVGRGDAQHPSAMGRWIAVRLQQAAPNVDAVGAWVDVQTPGRTQTREVTVGGGHAGGQIGWLHSGIGDATSAQVRVHWPSGEVGPWMRVEADQFVVIERGAPQPRPWTPAS